MRVYSTSQELVPADAAWPNAFLLLYKHPADVRSLFIHRFDSRLAGDDASKRKCDTWFSSLYGLESVAALESLWCDGDDANSLCAYWNRFMTTHERLDTQSLLGAWSSGQFPVHHPRPAHRLLQGLDEFALVLRWLRSNERHVQLASQYNLEEDYVGVVLHNGLLLAATFFAPRWFCRDIRWAGCSAVTGRTPQHIVEAFRSSTGAFSVGSQAAASSSAASPRRTIVLLTDNTEIVASDSGELPLASVLYSGKLHDHSVKILLITTVDGIIVDCSPAFGGRTSEVFTLHYLFENSKYVKQLIGESQDVHIIADRGFRDVKPVQGVCVHLPAMLNSRTSFFQGEILYNQFESGVRSSIERTNARMKLFLPDFIMNSEFCLLDAALNVAVALANMRKGFSAVPPAHLADLSQAAAARLVQLSTPMAETVPIPPVEQQVIGNERKAQAWKRLRQAMALLPRDWAAMMRGTRRQEARDLAAENAYGQTAVFKVLEELTESKKIPDKRAYKLCDSNYLQNVQVRIDDDGCAALVQARVHASMRSQYHLAYICIRKVDASGTTTLVGDCSCEQGYISR